MPKYGASLQLMEKFYTEVGYLSLKDLIKLAEAGEKSPDLNVKLKRALLCAQARGVADACLTVNQLLKRQHLVHENGSYYLRPGITQAQYEAAGAVICCTAVAMRIARLLSTQEYCALTEPWRTVRINSVCTAQPPINR